MNNRNGPLAVLRNRLPHILLAACLMTPLIAVGGCATHQIRTPDSDPLEQTYQRASPQAFFWGLVLNPLVVTAKCGDGLNDVVVKPSFFHNLAGVLTLGIWMPSEVEFRCRAPHGDGGTFPEAPGNRPRGS